MAEELRNTTQLLGDFPDNDTQGNTAQDVRNLIYSITAVGAGETQDTQAGGVRQTQDPKGVTRLGNRRFRIDPGGEGLYLCVAQGEADIDVASKVRIAIVLNSDQTSIDYLLNRDFVPGGDNWVILQQFHTCNTNDIVSLEFDVVEPGAILDVQKYHFSIQRIG